MDKKQGLHHGSLDVAIQLACRPMFTSGMGSDLGYWIGLGVCKYQCKENVQISRKAVKKSKRLPVSLYYKSTVVYLKLIEI